MDATILNCTTTTTTTGGARGKLWQRDYPMPVDPDSYLRIVYGEYWKIRFIPFFVFAAWHPIQGLQFLAHYIPVGYHKNHTDVLMIVIKVSC
jgi:hypothetical protein